MMLQQSIDHSTSKYREFIQACNNNSQNISREQHQNYLNLTISQIKRSIPGIDDRQKAIRYVERYFNQRYEESTEQRVTWSSCGREMTLRPIDDSCTITDLARFYANLNDSIMPKIFYKDFGNGFTLARLGDSGIFNQSSNQGLKITNQTGFISAGNYLLPWYPLNDNLDNTGNNLPEINVAGVRYKRSAKDGNIVYIGFEYETSNELRFFGYNQHNPVIKSKEGRIQEDARELVSTEQEVFLSLSNDRRTVPVKNQVIGQLSRIWCVVPKGFIIRLCPTFRLKNVKSENVIIRPNLSDDRELDLSEGTYSLHVPVLFPDIKTSHDNFKCAATEHPQFAFLEPQIYRLMDCNRVNRK